MALLTKYMAIIEDGFVQVNKVLLQPHAYQQLKNKRTVLHTDRKEFTCEDVFDTREEAEEAADFLRIKLELMK